MSSTSEEAGQARDAGENASGAARVGIVLIAVLALQTAVPPFATDMYTPAFPEVMDDLGTSAGVLGLTLTTFFVGLAAGQLWGGPFSDRYGRKGPLLAGALVCLAGAVGCALAPNVTVLACVRLVQGFGGGTAAVVARAVVVDLTHGPELVRVMSLLMALGGLAPMIAPVAGAAVLTLGTWRAIFWALAALGLLMSVTAARVVPESLPARRRRRGGESPTSAGGLAQVLGNRVFLGWMLVAALSGFAMMAYIADAPYLLQGMKGMAPLPYALFFASTALAQVVLAMLNARLVGRHGVRPQVLVAGGLAGAAVAVAALAVAVGLLHSPVVLVCAGFLVLMAVQAFIYGNSTALAAAATSHVAGTAAAVQGVAGALAMAAAAPLASAGGDRTAVPMLGVMVAGVGGSLLALLALGRSARALPEPLSE
ncbi:Bcr/CflA family efflux MFS transporter [Kineosporia sp. J2-2]|uniref:Bcr/CflA family efflux MFS transporter n=1 Tax=Kineosporia corallincola TaxID=2835133 RepID=A0ABS5TS84_9ACTN|nr:Bcr/CflA family efflux MFS transporter [Kineosporia corallincola]MBT0773654.1 Bcr/CflA family efflux MFS transporter [Kineosporia corallincola]